MRAIVDTSASRPGVLSGDLKEEQSIPRAICRRPSSPCWRVEGGVSDATETVVSIGGRPAVLHCSGISPLLAGLVRTRPSLARLIRRSRADHVQEGQAAPAMTSRLRHQLLDDLSAWHVRTVIIGPMGNRAAMRLFFTRLLDHPPVWSGGVDVWWQADHMVEVAGQPAGKNAVTL